MQEAVARLGKQWAAAADLQQLHEALDQLAQEDKRAVRNRATILDAAFVCGKLIETQIDKQTIFAGLEHTYKIRVCQ